MQGYRETNGAEDFRPGWCAAGPSSIALVQLEDHSRGLSAYHASQEKWVHTLKFESLG